MSAAKGNEPPPPPEIVLHPNSPVEFVQVRAFEAPAQSVRFAPRNIEVKRLVEEAAVLDALVAKKLVLVALV